MRTEEMREEFESRVGDRAWFVPGGRADESLPEGFEYEDFTTDMCWTCWVESRAAIEVELPKERSVNGHWPEQVASDMGFNDGVELCRDAIESLGLKVKP